MEVDRQNEENINNFSDLRTENVLINNDTGDLASLIDWQVQSTIYKNIQNKFYEFICTSN